MSSYNYRKNKGYESEPRSVSKKKSNNILISVVTVCVLLLAGVGAMGYFTGGFVTWDGTATAWATFKDTITGWFSPVVVEDVYLHKFKDFEIYDPYTDDDHNFYYLNSESGALEDIGEGDTLVIEMIFVLDGVEFQESCELEYKIITGYSFGGEGFYFEENVILNYSCLIVFFNGYTINSDFSYSVKSVGYSLVIGFEILDGIVFDSFNIINITYVPAEE